MTAEIPQCVDDDGHAWVSGRFTTMEDDTAILVSRQCRRCGYEDEFDDPPLASADPEDP